MCESWRNPSLIEHEFTPSILEKIPRGMKRLNITGGEPLLRKDLMDIVRILDTKTRRLEISTNGYFTDKILAIVEKFPRITIRVSIEGLSVLNDSLRGIKNGFDHALRTINELKTMGLKDIGFAMVISHNNIDDLLKVYRLSTALNVEFSQSTMHNSFYFFKSDNKIQNIDYVEKKMIEFIQELLFSRRNGAGLRFKDWFRAYINAGLLKHMKDESRAIPCYAGTESFFIDPQGFILACNGSVEPWVMGDLKSTSFDEIWNSPVAERVRAMVLKCQQNCWMTGSSVPAMRKNIFKPIRWVLINKVRLILKRPINEKI
jgi:MoaA/NifB/PqqE/SkfB family radical SAM enzyme